ncbi:MAG: DUF4838 domain-containing protein [Armatimonadota bacterium]
MGRAALATVLALLLVKPAFAAVPRLQDLRSVGGTLIADPPPRALAVGGRPAATIIVRAEPTPELLFAAGTLQEHIRLIADATLPVATDREQIGGNRILLGVSQASEGAGLSPPHGLAEDGYLICTEGPHIAILGASDRGTLNGVCGLLDDHLGVRWYVPGDPLGTVIPRRETIVLDELRESVEPSFPMRWVGLGTDWALYNRQSCRGASLSANFRVMPGIFHTQNALLPHDRHFREHPEWYALINGRRSADPTCKLCYSNAGAAAAVAAALGRLLDADASVDLVSFSPTDMHGWCECELCRALDESGVPVDQRMSRRSMFFYNAIAENLRRTHPQASLLVGAYNVYNRPPRDPSMRADPMLSVIVTHYEDYCMAHPIADPTCPRNRQYVNVLRAWDAQGTPVYHYEYYWKLNWMGLPWPIVHCIAQDIPWIHQRGDMGMFTQFSVSNAWTLYPNYYIAARLLWDVETDVDALFDRMCNDLFGASGPAVRDYYRVMEQAMASTDRHFPGHGTLRGPDIFTEPVLAEMGRHLRRARDLADGDLVRRRLAKLELSYDYTTRLMRYARLRASGNRRDLRQALDVLEALVGEVRGDRATWEGVVASPEVTDEPYLWGELLQMRRRVGVRR